MIIHVVGVRPNYVKAAPLIRELKHIDQLVVNTGQHYDKILTEDIMTSLEMKKPDINIKLPEDGGIFNRFGFITQELFSIMEKNNPKLVIVYGDVDSTLAASLAASRLKIPVAHVESGLRSLDNDMPEEVNRKLVDTIASLHFATEPSAIENLKIEGFVNSAKLVGNSMIDSLVQVMTSESYKNNSYDNDNNILLTCHRQSNVDNVESLTKIYNMCSAIERKIVFPVHPRTSKNMKDFGLYKKFSDLENVELIEPLDYCSFLKMMNTSCVVITDSGGIQEETTHMKVPCLTIRDNTERPSTIDYGTNTLVSFDQVPVYVDKIINSKYKESRGLDIWDGKAAKRIAWHITNFLLNGSQNG